MEREVFLTVWKKQATDREAAGILGMSEGAVRFRLHKARKKLKEALANI
jgi:DNA-directed RNA polymerase specialized sigma24 family protein